MAERNPSRPWSEEEDLLLIKAVQRHGNHDNWKSVASDVPGRTNKACRKRWLHSLSPTVKKSAWTPTEDAQLLALYNIHGPKWSTIAREISGRTDDACSKRYREALDPNLKKDEWTAEEDEKLMKLYGELGGKWGQLGQELQRSGLGCRNRYRLLSKKASKIIYDRVPDGLLEPAELPPLQYPAIDSSSPQNVELLNWPTFTYYSPDAYPSFPQEEVPGADHSLCESTTAVIPKPSYIPPFQYSSSSLNAALSDLPQNSRTLSMIRERSDDWSPPPLNATCDDAQDQEDLSNQTSQDDFSVFFDQDNDISRIFLGVHFDANGVFHYPDGDNSHLNSPHAMTSEHEGDVPGFIASPSPTQLWPETSEAPFQSTPNNDASTLSTPLQLRLSLSGASTPNILSPIDLPGGVQTVDSPMRSPERRSQPPRKASTRAARVRKLARPTGPTRLSSMLPLTPDPSIKPYACGRETCCPMDTASSSACFATSKELFDHSKIDHAEDPPGDRPFRCALAGCGKSWKSLNGLQYHLQISTAHFRNAMSSSFSSRPVTGTSGRSTSTSGSPTDAESGDDEAKRTYVCHHPDCFKAYRQPSGLRYHLKHGHPSEMPAQLSEVPPALARQLPSKTKKMRLKASTEGDA
ncbi:Myb-like protein A [Hypsizygus marmoreus]|uniref:Myb-like protein A n=1 Tax=Hypsizygus marmoreus TaxID=39966 RepID=A0A369KDF4_HYPMA|nr:Myb-like protein A [Hypsizygus marmoreus]